MAQNESVFSATCVLCGKKMGFFNGKVILNYNNEKEEKGTSVCWNYGTNVYETAGNKVYKNINLNEVSTEYAINSGFAFAKIGEYYNFYIF